MGAGCGPWTVAVIEGGITLAAYIRRQLEIPWRKAKELVVAGKVSLDGEVCLRADLRLAQGQTVAVWLNAPRRRPMQPEVPIVYVDRHVVVIDKPAGLISVPFDGEEEDDTALDLVTRVLRRREPGVRIPRLIVVHRIDRATSGLLVFARTKLAERELACQLRRHSMERVYLCVAHGEVAAARIESMIVADRGDGLRGSSARPGQGKRAVTHVEPVERLRGATLCRVRLETGRTHQIRIHLAEQGHPLVGETVYVRDFLGRELAPLDSPRLLLHAASLGFLHPQRLSMVRFSSPLPEDFVDMLERLRRGARLPCSGTVSGAT